MKDLYDKLTCILDEVIRKEFGVTLELPLWELPSKKEFGDLSSMASMKLASKLKEDPLSLAAKLKVILETRLGGIAERIEIVKPAFINIFFSRQVTLDSLNGVLEKKDDFFRRKTGRKVLLEFCSANPTGPLSIAHGRQAVIGDTIANILRFCGDSVVKEYYINDTGVQIDRLVESVSYFIRAKSGQNAGEFPQDGYKGEYIKEFAETVTGYDKPAFSLRDHTLNGMLDIIKNSLSSIGIAYDIWTSQQKDIIGLGKVDKTVAELREKNLIYEKENALWFSSEKFGDDKDRVIKKNDGELTYFASDIAYHRDKIERGFRHLINLWGPDHHGYIPRVKAALAAMGYDKNILDVIIIQLVTLKSKEKMSKRKGTAILLSELVEEVGKDAARYFYLTRRNSSILEFDIDLAKEASVNNPLFYAQYACARIESIFEKSQAPNGFRAADTGKLCGDAEIALARVIPQFSFALDKAYYTCEPVFIVEYIKVLAASFHRFYETTKVLTDDQELSFARLKLIEAVKITLHCALNILGITPARKM